MLVKQRANYSIAITRFDNKENLILEPDVETEVDEVTGAYLLNMRAYNGGGEFATDFIQV